MTDLWIFFMVLKDWGSYLPRFVVWGEVQIVTVYKEMNDMQIIYVLLAAIIYSIKNMCSIRVANCCIKSFL